MPIYNYKGRDAKGNLQIGKRTSDSPEALSFQLMKEGITPITISTENLTKTPWQTFKEKYFRSKPKPQELSTFARQMYTLSKYCEIRLKASASKPVLCPTLTMLIMTPEKTLGYKAIALARSLPASKCSTMPRKASAIFLSLVFLII